MDILLPILIANTLLLLAICIELINGDRLSVMLSVFHRFHKYPAGSRKKPTSFYHNLVSWFTLSVFFTVFLMHLTVAFIGILATQSPTQNIARFFLIALIAYASTVAITLAKDAQTKRLLAICLLLSNFFLSITLLSKDLVFFVLGMELTNLPFLLLILRANITNTFILRVTFHHLCAFLLMVTSLAIVTPFIDGGDSISFYSYLSSPVPDIFHIIAVVTFLLSPIARSFIPLFHIASRTIAVSSTPISFTVIALASMINIVFFIVLHDRLSVIFGSRMNAEHIVHTVLAFVVIATIIPAAIHLVRASHLPSIIFSAFIILNAELVFFISLTANADRYAFVIQFFTVALLSCSLGFLIISRVQKNGYPLQNLEDLQGIGSKHPVLLTCFILSLVYVLAIPVPYNFYLQPGFLFFEVMTSLSLSLDGLVIIVTHLLFGFILIPQEIALGRVIINCFAFPQDKRFFEPSDQSGAMFRFLILTSLFGLIVFPLIFGVHGVNF